MTAYITKYALTNGIEKVEASEPTGITQMIVVKTSVFTAHYHGEGREWHRTFESAVLKAEAMREKKIKSMQKAINKLKEIEFIHPTGAN